MKHLTKWFALFCSAMLLVVFSACSPKPEEVDTIEALIKTISISNGGLSGGDSYTGQVDNQNFVVTFNDVAAESNIAAVKFNAKLSLGAKLDAESYNFFNEADPAATELTQTLKVINATKVQEYKVIINLSAPSKAPLLDKLVMKDAAGNEYRASVMDNLLLLGMPDAPTAQIAEIVLTPLRSTYEFTTMVDGVLSASDPGMFRIDFMGLTTEYEVSFATSPTPGADFTQAVVHDFSVATNNVYPDYAGEMTRGGDFDGQYVLVANRTAPKVFRVEDLLNDNASNPILLNMTGVDVGTHVVSAGRVSHGHVYLCNLSVGLSPLEPLRVYHYATPNAEPEVVLSWCGNIGNDTIYKGRLGDNISINLDESGNGYAYFAKQEPGDKIYRFTVSNYTHFSDPFEISLQTVSSYYGYYNQVADNQYLFTSSYVPMLWLKDADGNDLTSVEFMSTEGGAKPMHGVDPRIITFNRSRYLLFTVANSQGMHWNFGPVLYLFDITDGFDIPAAFVKLQDAMMLETFEPTWEYMFDASGATVASACTAQTAAAEVDGKLVIFTAAANAGFALIEVPKIK